LFASRHAPPLLGGLLLMRLLDARWLRLSVGLLSVLLNVGWLLVLIFLLFVFVLVLLFRLSLVLLLRGLAF
jgi:hypothetical protein